MVLIRVGDQIINMDAVTNVERRSNDVVRIYFKIDAHMDFSGDDAKALWDRLNAIERSGKP